MKMRWRMVLVFIAVLLVAYGWVRWDTSGAAVSIAGGNASLMASETEHSNAGLIPEKKADLAEDDSVAVSSKFDQFMDVELVDAEFDAMSAEDQLVSALDPEEAAWLRARGYPSAWELAHLDELDWDKIDAAWNGSKDPIAAALQGERFLRAGDVQAARAAFRSSSTHGSLYGKMRLGLMEAEIADPESSPQPESPYLLFRLATMLAEQQGDHQAAALAQRHLSHLQANERARLDRLAFGTLLGYSDSWRRTMTSIGKSHLTQPVVRPNGDHWDSIRKKKEPRIVFKQLHSPFVYR